LTYIGLAVVQVSADQRRRARLISIGAVVVSVLYNTLSGLFHRRPEVLVDLPLAADVAAAAPEVPETDEAADTALQTETPRSYTCKKCGTEGFTFAELGRHSRHCTGVVTETIAAD